MVTTEKNESLHVENARLLGDRRLAEEALERNLLSCKFIRIYFIKTSFPMTRMIGYAFQKPAILKLPKLVTCPLTAITTQSPKGEGVIGLFSRQFREKC
ncbi:MAG: hypothetical protein ACLQGU_08125 [bacterium]